MIEIDSAAHDMGERPARDARRDAYLAQQGLRARRYRAAEVMRDPDGVAQSIYEAAAALSG